MQVVVHSASASSLPASHDEVSPLSQLLASYFLFILETTQQQTDGRPSGWLQLTLHLEMGTKVCNGAPKINRMWLIAATVTLNAQTVRTGAWEEMRGAFAEESKRSHLLWKSCATEISKASMIRSKTTAILYQSSSSVSKLSSFAFLIFISWVVMSTQSLCFHLSATDS